MGISAKARHPGHVLAASRWPSHGGCLPGGVSWDVPNSTVLLCLYESDGTLYISGIIQYMPSYDWLLSLSIMSSRFFHNQ